MPLIHMVIALVMTVGGVVGMAYAGKATIWLIVRVTGPPDPSWFSWAPQDISLVDIIVGGLALCAAALCGGFCCRPPPR